MEIHAPVLLGKPVLVALLDEFGEGGEGLVIGIDGVADEGDEVGEDFGGRSLGGGFCECLVGLPDGGGGEVIGWLGEGVAEFLNGLVGEAGAGALVVDDLEGGEAVAVFLQEAFEVFDGLAWGDGFGCGEEFVLAEDIDEDG